MFPFMIHQQLTANPFCHEHFSAILIHYIVYKCLCALCKYLANYGRIKAPQPVSIGRKASFEKKNFLSLQKFCHTYSVSNSHTHIQFGISIPYLSCLQQEVLLS